MTLFVNGTVTGLPSHQTGTNQAVSVRTIDDRISEVGALEPQRDEHVVDLAGHVLAPGFVDIQCNGALGIDLASQPDRIWEFAAQLPRWGVTSVLPTFVSSSITTLNRAMAVCGDSSQWVSTGARVLGLHFEGPFLNERMSGAHAKPLIQAPGSIDTNGWTSSTVSLVTIAPEIDGALAIIQRLSNKGIIVSLGHSAASAATVATAIDQGATAVTHLFNAMPALHHREPGLTGAALSDDRLFVSLICDGIHVDQSVIKIASKLLGKRLILITDAVSALGMSPGVVTLGKTQLYVSAQDVRLQDGTLAGSILSMDAAVRNLMTFSGCSLFEAIEAATSTPASLLRREDIGQIKPGAYADFVELTGDGHVVSTWVGGSEVFRRSA